MSEPLEYQLADFLIGCEQADEGKEPRLTDETVRDANLRGYTDFECGLLRDRIDALERRIEIIERKLNHKGGEE